MLIKRAGELRHRIAIESSDGSSGWQVDQWQMADVRPKASGIWFLPSGLTPKETHGVLTRYARCLTQRSRVLIPVEHATLAAEIDDTETAITITPAMCNKTWPHLIRVADEIMLVESGGGTTSLTVVRGYDNTTAVVHANGSAVLRMSPLQVSDLGDKLMMNNTQVFAGIDQDRLLDGILTQTCTIRRRTSTTDDRGQVADVWADVYTGVAVREAIMKSDEDTEPVESTVYDVDLYFSPTQDVTARDLVIIGTKTYDVQGVDPDESRNGVWKLAKAVMTDA